MSVTTKLERLHRQAQLERGAQIYFHQPREIEECDANISLVGDEIERLALENKATPDFADQTLWKAAVESLGSRLVLVSISAPEVAEPEKETYPEPPAGLKKFGVIRDMGEARSKIPGSVWKDYLYDRDRRTGLPSQRSLEFRAWIDSLPQPQKENR